MNTTYYCMYDYFEDKPGMPAGIISVGNKVFAGYRWDAINAHFHNGKFSKLNLRFYGNWEASSQSILVVYNSLKQDLINRYGVHLSLREHPDKNGVSGFYFYDGRYVVSLELCWHMNERNEKRYYEVGLWYLDVKLMNEPESPVINNDL